MDRQLSDHSVAAILISTMIISMAGTLIVVTKMSDLFAPEEQKATGFAEFDTGYAKIFINSVLAIDVDDDNNTIDFGDCTPTTIPSSNVSISSEMNETEINLTAMSCANSTLPAYIKILNTGNVDANLTVYSNKLGDELLSSSRGEIYYKAVNGTTNGGCALADLQSTYYLFDGVGLTNRTKVCENLTWGGTSNTVYVYINLTVPNDARTPETAEGDTVNLTFEGWNI